MGKLKEASSTPANSGSVTLRFDSRMLDELRKESEHRRVSLNTLATQIFRTHSEYGAMSAKAGMVSFHKSLLIRLMERLSEDEIAKLSEYIAKNEMKDTILRDSGATSRMVAEHGSYQQMLGGAKPAQMMCIELDEALPCFPEVSANKYAINIRFNSLDAAQKPRQCDMDIHFKLTLCNL